ncbi:MAG: hypothetical protein U1F71_02605 [Verrucomicrobiaceae bacterium]
MSELDKVVERLREECHNDEVGLWELVREAEITFTEGSLKHHVLEIARRLLCDPNIRAGVCEWGEGNGLFRIWNETADVILNRISNEWDVLEHKPNIGEVVYFTCPTIRRLPTA